MLLLLLSQPSQEYIKLVGKALGSGLTPDEQRWFDRLLEENPAFDREFRDIAKESREGTLNELWERGLRVLLKCPQPGDEDFLKSQRESDPKGWNDFLRSAFVLNVMAESQHSSSVFKFDNALTPDEEQSLFAALDARKKSK